jgi:hypothetical protein
MNQERESAWRRSGSTGNLNKIRAENWSVTSTAWPSDIFAFDATVTHLIPLPSTGIYAQY